MRCPTPETHVHVLVELNSEQKVESVHRGRRYVGLHTQFLPISIARGRTLA